MFSRSPVRVFRHGLLLLPIALSVGCSDAPTAIVPRATAPTQDLLSPVISVTNTEDTGPGSLRQAIIDATDGATIRFDAAIAGRTILVNPPFMAITKSVTIEGPLQVGMTISGNLSSRVFRVDPGVSVVLRNLSIDLGRHDIPKPLDDLTQHFRIIHRSRKLLAHFVAILVTRLALPIQKHLARIGRFVNAQSKHMIAHHQRSVRNVVPQIEQTPLVDKLPTRRLDSGSSETNIIYNAFELYLKHS